MSEPERPLTPREHEIVQLVVDGLSNKEIAAQLVVSMRTVQSHLASAMSKTDTRTRTQLAVYALRHRLVPLEPEQPTAEPDSRAARFEDPCGQRS